MEIIRNNNRRFYFYITLLTAAGWAWIIYCIQLDNINSGISVCIFKNITSIPCPACGSTHSVLSIFSGNWWLAIQDNPLGYIIGILLIIIPIWLAYDALKRATTLYNSFTNIELKLKQNPYLLISGAALIISNWIWNITKL